METYQVVCLVVGTVLAVAYIVLLMSSRPYDALVQSLDPSKHFFLALYPLGFMVLDKTHYAFTLPVDQERRSQCEIIYGKKYAEYYLRLNYAQKVSLALFILPVTFLLMAMLNAVLGLLLGVVLIVCAYWYYDMQVTDEMQRREDEVARDLPDVLSKLTLLVSAGMILTEAWERVSLTAEGTIYREMRFSVEQMRNGTPEADALIEFGNRCTGNEVKKFCSTLVQNLSKGNSELVVYLKKQTSDSWEEKKHYARRKGEAAGTQLMIPTALMLVGILVMIAVPLVGNFNF